MDFQSLGFQNFPQSVSIQDSPVYSHPSQSIPHPNEADGENGDTSLSLVACINEKKNSLDQKY